MHRHQAIVPFLLYKITTKLRGLQLHITERRHFTAATPFRVRAMWIYSPDRECCCQSPFPSFQLLAALTASLVSYGVVTLVWRSHTHERAARGSGCKPIIGFVLAAGFLQYQSDCRTANYRIPITSRKIYYVRHTSIAVWLGQATEGEKQLGARQESVAIQISSQQLVDVVSKAFAILLRNLTLIIT